MYLLMFINIMYLFAICKYYNYSTINTRILIDYYSIYAY